MKLKKIIIVIILTIVLSMNIMESYSIEELDVELVGVYDLENTYMINETVNIPQLSLKVDGEIRETNVYIHQPNQVTVSKKEINLNLSGLYTIEYNALYNSKVYSKTFQLEVTRNLYKFSGSL